MFLKKTSWIIVYGALVNRTTQLGSDALAGQGVSITPRKRRIILNIKKIPYVPKVRNHLAEVPPH